VTHLPKKLLIAVLTAYRLLISPLYGQTCRFYPSCSAYALTSIETHGAVKGSWLALRRLGRCHPWTAGGVDLVPPRDAHRWWGLVPGMDGSTEPAAADAPRSAVAVLDRQGA
jgi:uncharacterized protein